MFSDRDIKAYLSKEIVIHPYSENNLTPLGYNLSPSDFVFSLQDKDLILEKDGYYHIKPHDTVLILTKESVWISKKIAGTFHSKVGVVSNGFGHISTTLDPNWNGPLLISINNPTKMELKLPVDKTFITLIFYKLRTPSSKDHDNVSSRKDILKSISDKILENDLSESQRNFIAKTNTIFNDQNISQEFSEKVRSISTESKKPIKNAIKRSRLKFGLNVIKYYGLSVLCIILILAITLRIIIHFKSIKMLGFLLVLDQSTVVALIPIVIGLLYITKPIKEEIK